MVTQDDLARLHSCVAEITRIVDTLTADPATPPTPTSPPPPTPPAPPALTPTPGWPGPDSTGVPAGVMLMPHKGALTVTTAGAVIDGLDVDGCVVVNAANVTIRRCRVRGTCTNVIQSNSIGLVVEDTEIDGLGVATTQGIGWGDYTARRVNIHSTGDGARANGGVLIEDSWIHDLVVSDVSHNDGIQITEGSGIVIRHNNIENPNKQTSAILVGAHQGNIADVTVKGNLLAGGGYALYGGSSRNGYTVTNIKIINNQFSTKVWPKSGFYGPTASMDDPQVTASGNTWQGSGAPVN